MNPRVLLVLLFLAGLLAVPAHAQIPPGQGEGVGYVPHPEASEAISKLKSPYCPGQMLLTCPSPQAAALRDSIEMFAQGGVEADSLVEWMLANHGEEWRAIPKTRGKGILAWILPPLGLVLGLVIVALVLRRLAPPREREPVGNVELSDEDLARMKEALEELEREDEPVI